MARYRKVDPRIWNDGKFRGLSDNAKLVFFMLLTHPSMTALGAMRGTEAGLASEMKWTSEAFGAAFGEVLAQGMAEHDPDACFVGLPNFIRYNEPESPNVIKAWAGALDLLPECEHRNRTLSRAAFFAKVKGKAFREALPKAFREALPEAWPKTMPIQEQEQEQEQQQDQDEGDNHPTSPGTDAPAGDAVGVNADDKPQAGQDGDQAIAPKASSQKSTGAPIAGLDLPEWMPAEPWGDFVAMRRQMGKQVPFTLAAAKGIVRDLTKLRDEGHDPGDILDTSVKNGWRGVFAPKPAYGARPVAAPRQSRYAAAGCAIFGGSNSTGGEVFDV